MTFKAITFDFWNTLYKNPSNEAVAWQRAEDVSQVLNKYGYHKSLEEIRAAFQVVWQTAFKEQRVRGREIKTEGHVNLLMNYLHLNYEEYFYEEVYTAYTSPLLKMPPLLNDFAKEVLDFYSHRYKLGLICNTGATPGAILKQIMTGDKVIGYFNCLVFSDEQEWAKPHTEIFRYTLEKLNTNPFDAVHIGDDPITDVIGAKKAGMSSIWLEPQPSWGAFDADYHIANLSELMTIIRL